MLNIEIHGVEGEAAEKVRKRIEVLLQGLLFSDEIVITGCDTNVRDVAAIPCTPHLRICSTDMDIVPSMIDCLKPLRLQHVGIEVLKLEQWFPPLA